MQHYQYVFWGTDGLCNLPDSSLLITGPRLQCVSEMVDLLGTNICCSLYYDIDTDLAELRQLDFAEILYCCP